MEKPLHVWWNGFIKRRSVSRVLFPFGLSSFI